MQPFICSLVLGAVLLSSASSSLSSAAPAEEVLRCFKEMEASVADLQIPQSIEKQLDIRRKHNPGQAFLLLEDLTDSEHSELLANGHPPECESLSDEVQKRITSVPCSFHINLDDLEHLNQMAQSKLDTYLAARAICSYTTSLDLIQSEQKEGANVLNISQ